MIRGQESSNPPLSFLRRQESIKAYCIPILIGMEIGLTVLQLLFIVEIITLSESGNIHTRTSVNHSDPQKIFFKFATSFH